MKDKMKLKLKKGNFVQVYIPVAARIKRINKKIAYTLDVLPSTKAEYYHYQDKDLIKITKADLYKYVDEEFLKKL